MGFSKTESVGKKQSWKKRERIDRLCKATTSNGLNARTPKEIAALEKFNSKTKYTKAQIKELTGLKNASDLDKWKKEYNEFKDFLPKAITKNKGRVELIKKHGGLMHNAHKASDIINGLVKAANKEPNKRKSFWNIRAGLNRAIKKEKTGVFGGVSGVGERLKELQAEISSNATYKHFNDRFVVKGKQSNDLTCKQNTSYTSMANIRGKRQPEADCEAAAKNAYLQVKELATRHAKNLKSQSPLDDENAQAQKEKIETQLEILKEAKADIKACNWQPIANK